MSLSYPAFTPTSNPSPGSRKCCLLTPLIPPGLPEPGVGIADPDKLGRHKYGGGDVYGMIYCCSAGFVDLGHVRDHIDLTRYYYESLRKLKFVKNSFLSTKAEFPGRILLTTTVPKDDRIEVARSIAYYQSVAYEIFQYGVNFPGFHNSSFSPEDLVSNYLGTYVSGLALRDKKAFDLAATNALSQVMTLLGAQPPTVTALAFSKIDGIWVKSINKVFDFMDFNYLKRRNLNVSPIIPCLVEGLGCASTEFPSSIPLKFDDRILGYYDLEFVTPPRSAKDLIGETLNLSTVNGVVEKIKADLGKKPGMSTCGL